MVAGDTMIFARERLGLLRLGHRGRDLFDLLGLPHNLLRLFLRGFGLLGFLFRGLDLLGLRRCYGGRLFVSWLFLWLLRFIKISEWLRPCQIETSGPGVS